MPKYSKRLRKARSPLLSARNPEQVIRKENNPLAYTASASPVKASYDAHKYIFSDLKLSLLTGAFVFAVLIVLYVFLR